MTNPTPKKEVLVKDIMTKKIVSVTPDTPIFEAARMISDHNFDGIPVVDESNHLVGILTEYDLITKTSAVNISFMQKILNEVYVKESDVSDTTKDESEKISSLKVSDIMNKEPLSLKEDSKFEDVIYAFITHHRVNPIPIVDNNNRIVGIVSRFDVLRPLNLLGYGNNKK